MPDHDQQTKSTILAASTWRNAEREEPIPIDKPAHATRHVVMTLGPGDHAFSRMPDLAPKDRITASAELEVTVDAKDAADAVRKPYDYAPSIEAELLLAADPQATDEESGRAISLHHLAPVSCNHDEHHHIVYFDPSDCRYTVPAGGIPWSGPSHLNLVLSARHERAEPGQVLLIGQNEPPSNGKKASSKGNMAKLNVVRRRGPGNAGGRKLTGRSRWADEVPIDETQVVVKSIRLANLKRDEQLVLRGELCTHNPHPYPARLSTRVVLAEGPDQDEPSDHVKDVAAFNGEIGKYNGSNCLPAADHSNHKVGTLRILGDADRPMYANLVAVSGNPEKDKRWGPGDALSVVKGSSFMEIERFPANALG